VVMSKVSVVVAVVAAVVVVAVPPIIIARCPQWSEARTLLSFLLLIVVRFHLAMKALRRCCAGVLRSSCHTNMLHRTNVSQTTCLCGS
jgi:hypothetical protein